MLTWSRLAALGGALVICLLIVFPARGPEKAVVTVRESQNSAPVASMAFDPPPPPPPPPPLPTHSPDPPPPSMCDASCTKLSCTTKLRSLEPDWVKLSAQPR